MRLLSTENADSTTAYTRLPEPLGESKTDNQTTAISIREDLVEDIDALRALAQHYLIRSHPHSTGYWVFKSVLLATASLSSGYIYIKPSLAYGDRHNDKQLGITEAVCTAIGAVLVTLNISLMYIHYLERRYEARSNLRAFVKQANTCMEKLKEPLTISGAILSAIPLTAFAIQYSSSLLEKTLLGIVTTLDYGLIHTLGMQFLIENPWLRRVLILPALWELGETFLYDRFYLSDEQLYAKLLAEQTEEDHRQLKKALQTPLIAARNKILHASFKFDFCKLEFIAELPDILKSANEQKEMSKKPEGLDRYLAVLETANSLPQREERTISRCGQWFNYFASKAAWLVGTVGVSTSLSGFMMSAYNESEKITHSSAGAVAMSALPDYINAILLGYFGGKTIQSIYDYIVARYSNKHEIPRAVQLYPKTVSILFMLSGYVAYYSSGSAEDLVTTNFTDKKWDGIRELLIGFARYGIQLYTFVNMFEIICNATMLYARKYGNNDAQCAADFSEKIDDMVLGIELSDGKKLQKSLAAQPVPQRQLLLGGMDEKEFKRLTAHKENLDRKIKASSACGLAFFYGKRGFLNRRPSVEMKEVPSSVVVNTTPTVSTPSTATQLTLATSTS